LPPSETYDFSISLKGTFALTVVPGVRGTPAKVKPAENAGPADASQNRIEKRTDTNLSCDIASANCRASAPLAEAKKVATDGSPSTQRLPRF
jgi:hypothetical protein